MRLGRTLHRYFFQTTIVEWRLAANKVIRLRLQKKLLTDTVKNLHRRFISEHIGHVSYTAFWVVALFSSDPDTSLQTWEPAIHGQCFAETRVAVLNKHCWNVWSDHVRPESQCPCLRSVQRMPPNLSPDAENSWGREHSLITVDDREDHQGWESVNNFTVKRKITTTTTEHDRRFPEEVSQF